MEKDIKSIIAKALTEILNLKEEIQDYDASFESLEVDSMDIVSLTILLEDELPEFSDLLSSDSFFDENANVNSINELATIIENHIS